MTQVTCRIKDYIQPFERKLALQELSELSGAEPRRLSQNETSRSEFAVETAMSARELAGQLAYWEGVKSAQIFPCFGTLCPLPLMSLYRTVDVLGMGLMGFTNIAESSFLSS